MDLGGSGLDGADEKQPGEVRVSLGDPDGLLVESRTSATTLRGLARG